MRFNAIISEHLLPGALINHSAIHDNCKVKKMTCKEGGKSAVLYVLKATHDIAPGEEILRNYRKVTSMEDEFRFDVCPCMKCNGRCICAQCKKTSDNGCIPHDTPTRVILNADGVSPYLLQYASDSGSLRGYIGDPFTVLSQHLRRGKGRNGASADMMKKVDHYMKLPMSDDSEKKKVVIISSPVFRQINQSTQNYCRRRRRFRS